MTKAEGPAASQKADPVKRQSRKAYKFDKRATAPAATSSKKKKWLDLEQGLKLIGIFFTATTVFFTCMTYQSSQKWKRAEFFAQEFKTFSSSSSYSTVNQLLDYNSVNVKLSPGDTNVLVTDDLLYEALAVDTVTQKFSETEHRIRNLFDDYFDHWSTFNRYLNAGLIDTSQIAPYIRYQVAIIADPSNNRKSDEFRKRIWLYLDYYQFHDVQELCRRLGYHIDLK